MSIPPYPLAWPDGLPRTENKAESQFRTSLSGALENVRKSLASFGGDTGRKVTDVVITSNVGGISLDAPKDTGVAIWFEWDGERRCIAVDRYRKVQCNLQAIHHILEARRTEMRHGGLHIVRQTFKGFAALPAPEQWWQVLGVAIQATAAEIKAAYRERAQTAHPDKGGSEAAMARLNAARDAGMQNPTARATGSAE
ncbi:MAG: J domain-containing protein [Rhabdaerophilum sp.]